MERTNYYYARRYVLAVGVITSVIWAIVTWLTIENNYRTIACVAIVEGGECLWSEPFKPAYLSWLWPLVLGTVTFLALPSGGVVKKGDTASDLQYFEHVSQMVFALFFGVFFGLAILSFDPGFGERNTGNFTLYPMTLICAIVSSGGAIVLYFNSRTRTRSDMRVFLMTFVFVTSLLAGFRGWQTGVSVFIAFLSGGLITLGLCAMIRRILFSPRQLA